MSKKKMISANRATREATDDNESRDTRSDFSESKLRKTMKLKNITELGLKAKDYLRMVQVENPSSFANGEKLVLGLPPA